jgi:ribosomal protein L37AE/L43A
MGGGNGRWGRWYAGIDRRNYDMLFQKSNHSTICKTCSYVAQSLL